MRLIFICEGYWEAANAKTEEAQMAVLENLKQQALATGKKASTGI